jgi:adenylate cyclase class 2
MPLEIELKMRLDDPGALEAKLRALGASCLGAVLEQNTYYDTAASDLRRAGHGLRLRIEHPTDGGPSRAIVTHKGPRAPGPLKTREETQVQVSESAAAGALLEALGYRPVLFFEKRRRRWRLDECNVEIDSLPHIDHYVEIEGPNEQAVLAARARIRMDQVPMVKKSYLGLLRDYLDSHGLLERCITFAGAKENGVVE